ncbi:gp53-like domain-containing protein [Burkholderia cenocepacia]|uniref:gp53-like domain-containing protein n=1 Tax=Burkholderia cenocepacia TaxID=95486 RepID=UPI003F7400BB
MWSPGSNRACNLGGCFEKLPDGTIIEWGEFNCPLQIENFGVAFPFPFPVGAYMVSANYMSYINPTQPIGIGAQPVNATSFTVTCASSSPGALGVTWIAMGF